MLTSSARVAVEPPATRAPASQSRWWFVASAAVVAVLGLLANRWTNDELDSRTASDVRAVLAGLSAISVLVLGLQLVLVGILSDPHDRAIRRPPTFGVTSVAAAVCAAAAAIATFGAIDSSIGFRAQVAAAVALAVASMVITVPARSVLLGSEHWRDLGVIAVISALPRVVVSAVPGAPDALFAVLGSVVIGELLGAGLALAATARTPRVSQWPVGTRRHLWNGVVASAGVALVVVLSSVSFRSRLHSDVTAFSQSATVARLVFVLVFAVAFVFFPAMAREPVGSPELRRVFHRTLVLTTITAVAAAAAVVAVPAPFVALLTDDPMRSPTTIRLLAVSFAALGTAVVSLMQYVAHGSRFALWAWPSVVVMAVGQLLADDAATLAGCVLVSSLLLLVAASLPALLRVQPVLRPTIVGASRHDQPIGASATTIVVPAFNPGDAVTRTIDGIIAAFHDEGLDVDVVVVSDGSTDGSDELVDRLDPTYVRHIRHDRNRGKGAALRTGFAAAASPIVGFVDADGDLPPSQLVEMVRIQRETDGDIVFGSKRHAMSTVEVPMLRRLTSRTYQRLIRYLFQLDIADTQTGIKVFSRRMLDETLPAVKEDGFALDLEMFVAARCAGFTRFVEVPVALSRQGPSTISSRSAARMIVHTLRIFWRAKVTLEYLRAAAAPPDPATRFDDVRAPTQVRSG